MDFQLILTIVGWIIYGALAGLAVWGWFSVFLVSRQINRRRFPSPQAEEEFAIEWSELMGEKEMDAAAELCARPEHWYRAAPVLLRTALEKRHLSPTKLRQALAGKFEREILAAIENTVASINTVIKSAPMLGLLGTVVGMIGAFRKIAGETRVDPSVLADDINIALITTALGLTVAVPLVLASNFVNIKIRKLEDATAEQVQDLVEELELAVES